MIIVIVDGTQHLRNEVHKTNEKEFCLAGRIFFNTGVLWQFGKVDKFSDGFGLMDLARGIVVRLCDYVIFYVCQKRKTV